MRTDRVATEVLEEWAEELAAKGASSETVRGYVRHVRAALRDVAAAEGVLAEAVLLHELERRHVRSHLARWRTAPDRRYGTEGEAPSERSSASLRARLQALRGFARWCVEEGLCEDFTAGLKVPAGASSGRAVPDLETAERLLEAAAAGRNSARDVLLVTLLVAHGCALSELSAARVTALDLGRGTLTLRGKRSAGGEGEARILTLSPRAREAASLWIRQRNRYIASLPTAGATALFILRGGQELSADKLTRVIARVAARADVSVTSQGMRASFATLALQAGSSVPSVQHSLGIRSLSALRSLVGTGGSESVPVHPLSR